MDDKLLKKFAALRLEVSARKCDGCGAEIGRFTDKCEYDAKHDRAYCSTGGCAEKVKSQASCSSCDNALNPFEEKIHVVPGMGCLCNACATNTSTGDERLKGLKIIDPLTTEGLTEQEHLSIADGPYVVVETGQNFYQVILPLGGKRKHVRATGDLSVLIRLFRSCAKFNRAA